MLVTLGIRSCVSVPSDFARNISHISSVIRGGFSFQNDAKNLDPSYRMDLDL